MTWTEQLLVAVENSGAEAGKKKVALDFLRVAGPVVETLGPSVFEGIMRSAAAGSVPEELVERLDAKQVAGILGQLEAELGEMVETHAAEKAAWRSAMAQLQAAALSVVARSVVSAL
jgi:hypothetical protein